MTVSIELYPYVDSELLFSMVAGEDWSMFLDSGVIAAQRPVTRHADYDVLAIRPRLRLITQNRITRVWEGLHCQQMDSDPLSVLRGSLASLEREWSAEQTIASPYLPGAIGYFSYDLVRRFEDLTNQAKDDENLPEMAVGIYDVVVVVDHLKKMTSLISRNNNQDAQSIRLEWQSLLQSCSARAGNETGDETLHQHGNSAAPQKLKAEPIQENMTRDEYARSFQRVRDYTIAGDCYQVNLAKRFSARVQGDAWQTYVALRNASPAPYGAYFNLPFAQILSNSPESFIQCRQGKVITSPIKGTRPRDHNDPENDQAIADQLQNSAKDRSENLMIVDLMRNDISKCCELGSVKVPKIFELYSFANVHHLISTITGVLQEKFHALDLLRSCFPGGSITGAPKIRAMQIIEELEPHRRGLYCGAIGYVGMDGSLETNIAIRTIVVKDKVARFSAGGGLVIGSQVDEEYQEIIDKARMMTEALTNDATEH